MLPAIVGVGHVVRVRREQARQMIVLAETIAAGVVGVFEVVGMLAGPRLARQPVAVVY